MIGIWKSIQLILSSISGHSGFLFRCLRKDLLIEKEMPINWCPSCKTGLANEEVVNGCCERCGAEVTKKNLKQWMLKITAYADRLLSDLDKLDWPEKVKKMQTDWIGKSLWSRG